MRPAFPTSDYYGGSAPPGRYRWTTHLPTPDLAGQGSGRRSGGSHVRCGIDRRARCPAMPLRPRPAYAADFRRGLPAGHINRPRSHPTPTGAPGVHRDPAHIRQVGAGGILERRSTPVPHVHRPVLLAGPRPSGSAGPSRRCRGCLPPSPASPGSGCPQLQPPCCDKAAAKVSHLHSIPQRLVALHVPIPAIPATNLVVVQADLVLGGLEAFLDRPADPRHPDQLGQAGTGRAETGVEGQLSIRQPPAHQQPEPTARPAGSDQRDPGPVIDPGPLGASPALRRRQARAGRPATNSRAGSSAGPCSPWAHSGWVALTAST
jgi:hypothetical protein